jgi:lipopolysaccharide transport system permease protein
MVTSEELAATSPALGDKSTTGSESASGRNWDLVIRPQSGWFDLHLRDLWRYRDLIMLFVWRDFVAKYKQTILGPLWYLVQPLLTMVVFVVIFGKIAKIPTDGLPQQVFYLCGITAWNYFAECLNATSGTFIQNAGIFGKVYFPRLVIPISVVISGLIRFGIQFALFLAFAVYFLAKGANVHPNAAVLLTPYLIFLMAALGIGLGIIISSLTTRFRDLQFLVQFGVQLLMYGTPIVYPLSLVPERYKWIVAANPMSAIVESFRYGFLGAGSFDLVLLAYSTTTIFVIVFVGILLFNRVEKGFMDTV